MIALIGQLLTLRLVELPEVKRQAMLMAMTAYWSLRFGLALRPPLSPLQTALRFAIATVAVILLPYRGRWLERATLVCVVIAAGSSALFGIGFRSATLDVVRLLFHFFGYALGCVVSVRWLTRQAGRTHPSFVFR